MMDADYEWLPNTSILELLFISPCLYSVSFMDALAKPPQLFDSYGVFANRHIAARIRLQLLESLVFHCSGTWPSLTHLQYCSMPCWLTSFCLGRDESLEMDFGALTPCQMLNSRPSGSCLLPLSSRLAKHRLLYGFKIADHAPQDLVTCLSAADAPDSCSPWGDAR